MSEQVKLYTIEQISLDSGLWGNNYVPEADHDRALSAERVKVEEVTRQRDYLVQAISSIDHTGMYKNWIDTIQSTAPVPVSVPDGWKLVPVEPTKEMISVIINRNEVYESAEELYAALIAAAPQPSTKVAGDSL